MHNTLEQWIDAARDVLTLNERSYRIIQEEMAKAQMSRPLPPHMRRMGTDVIKEHPEESLSAESLFQVLFDTYDDTFVKAFLELRKHLLEAEFDAVLLLPARTFFEMATRKAPRILSESVRPRRISLITDFSTLAFSGSLGYSREEFLSVLRNVAEDPELPSPYVLSLLQLIDAVMEDNKLLFDQLLIDLRRAESSGLRKEEVNEEWLWKAPRDLMFSNVSHLVHGNPFSILGLEKKELARWRFYAFILQSDYYFLRLCQAKRPHYGTIVTEAQDNAYVNLQESGEKVLAGLS
ncbi:MAG TPA: hypothetical protein VLA04_03745 [Verrucomicrobiae bacterium]|nr:hypothetical protein [Verrucomicrobiae bacterium]